MPRSLPLLVCAAVLATASPAVAQSPAPTPAGAPDRVVITGRGSFHGLGMAMDGVEGQARAGWSHDRILSLFYPGTTVSRGNHGTVRVWIAEGGAQHVSLPSGGRLAGLKLPPGAGVTVRPAAGGRLGITVDGLPKPETKQAAKVPERTPSPRATPPAEEEEEEEEDPVPANPDVGPPDLPTPTSTPGPSRTPAPPRPSDSPPQPGTTLPSPIILTPHGQPALSTVTSLGRRYRGTIELRRAGGGVRVINHVSLDDYVSGNVEEKGQGWPLEGLKTLAVAARTLAVATMTWHDNNHADGYDICPTDKCQVYHGYDGEEYTMRQAALETSGEIRTYNGRPILAMYFGNGGGQTASYKELSAEGAGNNYPYLTSVKYPYADPWHWKKETTLREIETALRGAAGDKMPSPLKYAIVLKRGESPRVKSVGLFGEGRKGAAVTGLTFARALDLPSQWFYIHLPRRPPRSLEGAFLDLSDSSGGIVRPPRAPEFPWLLAVLAGALAAAAALSNWTANGGPKAAAGAWVSLRRRLTRERRRGPAAQPTPDGSPG